ncbi:MAG: ATP-binding cassette domain-containing protein [Candidatus Wallbacteria bacterium]|nr:ATP-binding cassette domain-containing protein [Candidatus Wallbacteria bacterium]
MILIKAESICKTYGSKSVIKDVSLEISRGEILLVKGESGAGKSTLMYLLSLLEAQDSGRILIEDTEVSRGKWDAVRRQKFGFLFQDLFLMEDLNCYENLYLPLAVSGKFKEKHWKEMARVFLEKTGITQETARQHVRMLSGGERSRIAFIRSVIHEPLICFCDEPTGSLDQVNERKIVELVKKSRQERGTGFVIVTHSKAFDGFASRILELKDGKLSS